MKITSTIAIAPLMLLVICYFCRKLYTGSWVGQPHSRPSAEAKIRYLGAKQNMHSRTITVAVVWLTVIGKHPRTETTVVSNIRPYFFIASMKSSLSPPFITACATAQVMTVSSVKKQSSRNKGNSFILTLCYS